MTDNIERVREKIRALLSKTTARGCTEAEAIAAAEKAAKLMAEHGLCASDLIFEEKGSRVRSKGKAYRNRIWSVVARCTNTALIVLEDFDGVDAAFVGQEPGPEIADYLRRVCDKAIDREISNFKKSAFYKRRRTIATKRVAVSDFTQALVRRLAARLLEIFGSTIDPARQDAAARALVERHSNVQKRGSKGAQKMRFTEAAVAGFVAADNVHLAHGVNGGKDVAKLENRS